MSDAIEPATGDSGQARLEVQKLCAGYGRQDILFDISASFRAAA